MQVSIKIAAPDTMRKKKNCVCVNDNEQFFIRLLLISRVSPMLISSSQKSFARNMYMPLFIRRTAVSSTSLSQEPKRVADTALMITPFMASYCYTYKEINCAVYQLPSTTAWWWLLQQQIYLLLIHTKAHQIISKETGAGCRSVGYKTTKFCMQWGIE